MNPPAEHLTFPFEGAHLHGWLRCPTAASRAAGRGHPAGLDACKEELHAWSDAFLARGLATLTLDGPGQGETRVRAADPHRLGQGDRRGHRRPEEPQRCRRRRGSASSARVSARSTRRSPPRRSRASRPASPIAAPTTGGAFCRRCRKCRRRCSASAATPPPSKQAHEIAKTMTLEGAAAAHQMSAAGGVRRRRSPDPAGGRRAARARGIGAVEIRALPEGNHVCFNISYKFRPLTADWMAETLSDRRPPTSRVSA